MTLTGPSGVGKTSLAIDVANAVIDRFSDGVAFMPLAPVTDPAPFVSAIVQALGPRDAGGQTIHELLQSYLKISAF